MEVDALSSLMAIYQKPSFYSPNQDGWVLRRVVGPLEITAEVLENTPLFLHFLPEWHNEALDSIENAPG